MSEPIIRHLDLSREELAFAMERLGIAELVGLEGGPLVLLPEEERPAAVAAGARGLIARGLAQQISGGPDPHWGLSPLVIAAVGTCATAADYVMVTQRTPQLPFMGWYAHLTPTLSVVHTLADAGVHRFDLCLRPSDLVTLFTAIFGAQDQPASDGKTLKIDNKVLTEASVVARREPDAARALLQEGGLDAADTDNLVGLLQSAQATTMVTRTYYAPPDTELYDVFGVVRCSAGFWIIEATDTPGIVSIHPVAAQELVERLERVTALAQPPD